MQIAILVVAALGAIGTIYLVSIESSRRRDERHTASRAAIAFRFERRPAVPVDRQFLVIANDGRGEAREVELLTFVSAADGRNAREAISDRDLLPIPRIAAGTHVALAVIQNFGGPNAPWSVATQWTDDLGTHVVEHIIVTETP